MRSTGIFFIPVILLIFRCAAHSFFLGVRLCYKYLRCSAPHCFFFILISDIKNYLYSAKAGVGTLFPPASLHENCLVTLHSIPLHRPISSKLALPACIAQKTLTGELLGRERQAKAEIVVAIARVVEVAVRHPAVRSVVAPATATDNAVGTRSWPCRVVAAVRKCAAIPVAAPLHHIATHVVQA